MNERLSQGMTMNQIKAQQQIDPWNQHTATWRLTEALILSQLYIGMKLFLTHMTFVGRRVVGRTMLDTEVKSYHLQVKVSLSGA